ncbi:MAG: helix-turn-helix transcriptional regulator [Acidobacteria bacterium]|nr:helix-turn-helix transcriptional regulator [Acidobacteriota bacterium]
MVDSNKKLRAAIKAAGIRKISEAAGVPYNTLHTFLNDPARNLRGDNLEKVQKALGEFGAPLPDSDVRQVAIYDIRASAGAGALVEDGTPSGWQPYRASEIDRWNIEDLAVIQVGGDSMWETLHDGDKVLVNRGERRIVKPGIYILAYEGELLVKRCQRNLNDGSVMVSSDNPAYASFKVDDPEVLNVIGRVVWIGRALG